MAVTTYAELVASPAAQKDFLLTIEPKERLREWTKTAGFTYTYEKPWAAMYGDGFCSTYRRLTGIRENGTALTERASVALVDANAGSYFQDEADGRVYVHLADGGTADRSAVWLVAFFKLFFSSGLGAGGRGKIFEGIYYEPLFSAKGAPAISAEQTEFLAGGGMSTGDASFVLANHARFFDRIWTAWSWKNAAVELRHGGEDLPLGEYALVYSGTVREEAWQAGEVRFDTVNRLEVLKRNVPVNPLFGPGVKDEDRGKPIPLCFGRVAGIAPLCSKADPEDATEWTIADPDYQTLAAIEAVYDSDVPVDPANYTTDLAGCRFTFVDYTPGGEVTVDVRGARIGDIPGESSAELMENPADIVRFFLKAVLGFGDADLNTASFAQARTDLAEFPLAKYVRFRRNLASYLAEIERSTLSTIFQDNDGRIGMAVYDPFFEPDAEILNEEIVRFSQASPSSKLYAGVTVYYNPRPYTRAESGGVESEDDTYDVTEGANTGSRYLDGEETATRRVVTWLRTAEAAAAIRDRVLFLTNRPIYELSIEVAGGTLFARRPGEIVSVTKRVAPAASGEIDGELFRILSLTKDVAGNKATVRLDSFAGTPWSVGTWCGDAAPAWATATEDQRRTQGFWCDDEGLVVPGDLATAEKSVWW